ncbi:MAG: hypothetical protein KTR31_33645 [Myxococcales bacterium]|nr:hypothetical protein [Myxococcales bacterium]
MSVLVTGFGPFLDVTDNPSAALARAVDGCTVAGRSVVGRVLPVSFARGPDEAIRLAREEQAVLVVGLGVARRTEVCVERVGQRVSAQTPDVDGAQSSLLDGPEVVPASLDVQRLSSALGARISDDAGRYVCNAWLYRVTLALDVPVGFVHVPPEGMDAQRLLDGIASIL